jgi:hypothetical protein
MPTKDELVEIISSNVDVRRFKEQHWEGNFWDYLDLVAKNPSVARNSFQRLYDMILHFGAERYTVCREDYVRYHFFADPIDHGADAIFGLDKPLMNLVDFFRSAAYGYGTEKRILLLHGPVGSSKSTIARLLKKGLEYYSALEDGALYTFSWKVKDKHGEMQRYECPMHEEPLKLIPYEARPAVLEKLNADLPENQRIRIVKVMDHIVVHRLVLSEKDRVGIGTFQPKDEKNQDSHRADRRHQLSQDRRVRQRQRSAGVQLRRRAEHRQSRDDRVHRGAQARCGVPLRPAGRVAGAFDQAQEIRSDRHRRGDHRAHQRAGVSQAPGQRSDGGVPRPHHQDRHALQHQAQRRNQDLREGLQ